MASARSRARREASISSPGISRRNLVRLELLQARHYNLRQMALLVAIGDLDGFIQLAFAQRAGHGRSESARLLLGGVIRHEAVDHDADGIGGHEEQQNNDAAGQSAHLRPEVYGVPTYAAIVLQH